MCKNEREGTLKEGEDSVEMQSIQSMAAVTSVLGLQKHCVCGTRGRFAPSPAVEAQVSRKSVSGSLPSRCGERAQ